MVSLSMLAFAAVKRVGVYLKILRSCLLLKIRPPARADVPALRAGSGHLQGHGSVINAVIETYADASGLERLWLTTTNDNLDALALYQRCGFRITRVVVGGVDEARELKPSIPVIGARGIPVHDELVLECALV